MRSDEKALDNKEQIMQYLRYQRSLLEYYGGKNGPDIAENC